jgi:hypothetical protein
VSGAVVGGGVTLADDFLEDGKFNKSWKEYAWNIGRGATLGAVCVCVLVASLVRLEQGLRHTLGMSFLDDRLILVRRYWKEFRQGCFMGWERKRLQRWK